MRNDFTGYFIETDDLNIIGGVIMALFKGAGVAIVTPFNEKYEVDFEKLGELIEFQIANKTDSIIICGTTGEASTLTHDEHLECIKYTVNKVNKRVPVIAGTGSNCTETAIYLSKEAEEYGADGLLIVTPYYNKATQKGLIAHFTAIANSVSLPIIMYNVPARTGCNMLPQTVATLVKNVDNIVGIKEASSNIAQVADIMSLTQGNIDLYSGCDEMIVPILSLGGMGVISVLSNVAPRQTHDMVAKYFEGDVRASRDLQLKYIPLINALFCEVNPIPVKTALNLMGLDVGPLRMPLIDMEPVNVERLRNELRNCNIETHK
jgi:4-hydroxy-tetrahydrodipicolinate synthase